MVESQWPVLLILFAGMAASVGLQKLTLPGAFTGGVIGYLIFLAAGYTGLAIMATFFVLGTAATAWRKGEKIKQGLAEQNESRRTAAQVVANAGLAGLVAIWMFLQSDVVVIGNLVIAAVFASATADTLSSELGNVYGKRFYNILTFKKDRKGLNGVVSMEGIWAGLAGSFFIAIIFIVGNGWNGALSIIIILAGTIGNVFDSLLGATLERGGKLNNDGVNFLNTAVAATAALLLYTIIIS